MIKITDRSMEFPFHFKFWFPVMVLVVVEFLLQDVGAAFESTYTVSTRASVIGYPNGISYDPSEDTIIMGLFDILGTVAFVKDNVTTTISGSPVQLNKPYGLWHHPTSKDIFVASWGSSDKNVVAKINPITQLTTKFAGTGSRGSAGDGGPATSATLNWPTGVFGDTNGNLFVAEEKGQRVRKINKSDNKISTVAGGGSLGDGNPATSVSLAGPVALFVDTVGDIFISSWQTSGIIKCVSASTGNIKTIAGGGSATSTTNGVVSTSSNIYTPYGIWGDSKGNIFVIEHGRSKLSVVAKENNYEKTYLISSGLWGAMGIFGDEASGRLFISQFGSSQYSVLQGPPGQPRAPAASPSTSVTIAPSQTPSISPTIASTTLAVPMYSLTVSAKSFKYFEVKVFTEANERVFPVSYELEHCPGNADAEIWHHNSTSGTENEHRRHYWSECPDLVNGNKPKLTLNFGGTVFDRVELLILDWVDGEVKVTDTANNIVLFSASRAGGLLAGEEFVGYDHLNLLLIVPTVVHSSVPSATRRL